jgi:hypothetical protein
VNGIETISKRFLIEIEFVSRIRHWKVKASYKVANIRSFPVIDTMDCLLPQ